MSNHKNPSREAIRTKKKETHTESQRLEETCLVNFSSDAIDSICRRAAGKKLHLLMQYSREFVIYRVSRRMLCYFAIVFHKPHMNLLQVRKWDTSYQITNRQIRTHSKNLSIRQQLWDPFQSIYSVKINRHVKMKSNKQRFKTRWKGWPLARLWISTMNPTLEKSNYMSYGSGLD